MNTPKLISPISSSFAAVDTSRSKAAHPAQGLDFSRLLGQMRSDTSAPAQSSSQNNASAPARSSSQNNAAPADNTVPGTPLQGASSPEPAEHAGAQAAANGAEAPAGKAGKGDKAAPAEAEATTDHAQLAEAAADAGLAGAAAPAANGAVAAVLPVAPGALAAAPVVSTPVSAVVLSADALPQGVVTATDKAMAGASTEGGAAADPRLAALSATPVGLQGAVPSLAAVQPQLAQAAQAALTGIQARATGVDADPNPATLPSAAGLNAVAGLKAMADTPAVQAAPLAPAGEQVTGAAALSLQLQEFNAMVAAARATSGTSLTPLDAAAENAGFPMASPSLTGLTPAGFMPVSLIPGQGWAPAAVSASIAAPLSSPQWPTELGRQFISITQAGKGLGQVAELRLDPPELGPLRITINLNDNVAHAVFSSPHALVRQTVENALPQLQQMLEQAGLSLGQANVNDQHQSDQPAQQTGTQAMARGSEGGKAGGTAADDALSGSARRPANPDALVDTFA